MTGSVLRHPACFDGCRHFGTEGWTNRDDEAAGGPGGRGRPPSDSQRRAWSDGRGADSAARIYARGEFIYYCRTAWSSKSKHDSMYPRIEVFNTGTVKVTFEFKSTSFRGHED